MGRGGASGADPLFVFDPRLVNYAPRADLATGICNRGCGDDAPASQKISLPGGSDGGAWSHPPGHPSSSSAGPLNVFPTCLPPQFSLSAPQKRSRGAWCLAHGMQVALVTQEKGQHPTSTTPGDTAQHTPPSYPHRLQQGRFLSPLLAIFKELTEPPGATMNHRLLMSPLPVAVAPGVCHPLRVPKCSSISLLKVFGKLTCGQITFTEGWNPQREGKLRHKAKLGLAHSNSSKAVVSAPCPQQTSRFPSSDTAQSPALQSQGVPQIHRRVPQCSQTGGSLQYRDKGDSP